MADAADSASCWEYCDGMWGFLKMHGDLTSSGITNFSRRTENFELIINSTQQLVIQFGHSIRNIVIFTVTLSVSTHRLQCKCCNCAVLYWFVFKRQERVFC